MSKITLTGFAFLLLLFLGNSTGNYAVASATAKAAKAQFEQTTPESQSARRSLDEGGTGTLQKMIVENGSVTMDLDLNGLTSQGLPSSLLARPVTLNFVAGANSFFPILVFNDLLRGVLPGTMSLVPAGVDAPGYNNLPVALGASLNRLVVEKVPPGQEFDLAVRDRNTGFTFFNVQGHQYDYDANARLFSITGGRLLISKQFAESLGRPADADLTIGKSLSGRRCNQSKSRH
jgi:hypothetical protein